MKIIHDKKEMTVQQAVEHKLYPNSYTYNGQLEKLNKAIELQSEMMAVLIQRLVNHNKLTMDDIDAILGYGYEIGE